MSETVKLLFGVHAHQPAGNFAEVVRDARNRCYGPFLEVLERHPEFPFAVHISGWLMEFLAREFPGDMRRLRKMVRRRQAEVFGGGDTEPVLAALPECDRRSQLAALGERIHKRFGVTPRGAWLTERVWEASVVPALAASGIRYVAVDDYHFLCAGQPREHLDGYFTTEEDCRTLDLFPISETLRYKVPFAPAADALAHIESMTPGGAAIYFDDIEKFGIWPDTHDWVYGRRWLEDFIEGVVRSPRIEPMRYADFHGQRRSRGIVYLPTVSYAEMGEWALPPRGARRFAELVERTKRESTFDLDKPYLRGGHWRNFFSRYPESNWMHKRMESASQRLAALSETKQTPAMRADLHLAQANDAYWHGLFGGIYLPHLRRQVYASLARLEAALERTAPRRHVECFDVDLDGRDEYILASRDMLAIVQPDDGASVRELTHYGLAHNFCDTLMRREEHYYDKIRAGASVAATAHDGPASIHDRVAFRTHVTEEDLAPDRHPRSAFVDFWTPQGEQAIVPAYVKKSIARSSVSFLRRDGDPSIVKRVKIAGSTIAVRYALRASNDVRGSLTVELNVAMPSCDGPGGAYVRRGERIGGFDGVQALEACEAIDLVDSELKGSLRLRMSAPALLDLRPLYTVSQSEAGFEKIMQAATLRATWPVELDPGRTRTLEMRLEVHR